MSGVTCAKCNGTGLIAREGRTADKHLHPILSQSSTVCDSCGGGGFLSPKDARAAERAAAKASNG